MSLVLEIICWSSFLSLLHSYIIFPLIARMVADRKTDAHSVYTQDSPDLPHLSIIISIYNEKSVLPEKLESLKDLDYPTGKIDIYLGSDASTDGSNDILQRFADEESNTHFFSFTSRRGKPHVVNDLAESALKKHGKGKDHILLITDANVILTSKAAYHLVKHFKSPDIALVDSHMVSTGLQASGISRSEHRYISREVQLKHWEGKAWGCMIGPFGGCYALRSDFYIPVPGNFLVDDFYIAMNALSQGADAINDLDAICYEAVSQEMREEYRRKARISAGNFQNLAVYASQLWPVYKPLGFAFLSHKVLRWFGPVFILLVMLSAAILAAMGNQLYAVVLLFCIIGVAVIPFLDYMLKSLGLHSHILRSITYFIFMNAALFEGLIKYLNGIRNNVWEPPKRNRVVSPE